MMLNDDRRLSEKVLANSVPAAAVIQRGQALFGMTGRKGYVGGDNNTVRKILKFS